ncbi:hypothetical protein AB6D40_022860 [Vibrio cyclitrophicus]|jgi:hypothetical protein
MQLEPAAYRKVIAGLEARMEQLKTDLLLPQNEDSTITLRGRYLALEELHESIKQANRST